jgi:hypothetical protein
MPYTSSARQMHRITTSSSEGDIQGSFEVGHRRHRQGRLGTKASSDLPIATGTSRSPALTLESPNARVRAPGYLRCCHTDHDKFLPSSTKDRPFVAATPLGRIGIDRSVACAGNMFGSDRSARSALLILFRVDA